MKISPATWRITWRKSPDLREKKREASHWESWEYWEYWEYWDYWEY